MTAFAATAPTQPESWNLLHIKAKLAKLILAGCSFESQSVADLGGGMGGMHPPPPA